MNEPILQLTRKLELDISRPKDEPDSECLDPQAIETTVEAFVDVLAKAGQDAIIGGINPQQIKVSATVTFLGPKAK